MDPNLAEIEVGDPGPGRRLDADARSRLRRDLRAADRSGSACVLVTVEGGAWDHAPEVGRDGTDGLAQEVVADQYQALVTQLFGLAVPVVVGLDGAVSGFGLALALAADVRVGTPATTVSLGAPRHAASLLGGATWLLERASGSGTLASLAWTGDHLTADVAVQRGLLARVSDDPAAARAVAVDLAGAPRPALSAVKRAINSSRRPELEEVLGYQSWLAGVAAAGS